MTVCRKLKFTSKSDKKFDNLQNNLFQKRVCEQMGKTTL